MSWFRVDDKLHAHRKARRAGPEAMGLWVMCGSYCSADPKAKGSIFSDEVEAIALGFGMTKATIRRACDRLVAVGLWEAFEDGFLFHDWQDYRVDGEEELIRRRERDAARKRTAYLRDKSASASAEVSAETSSENSSETAGGSLENSPHPRVDLPLPILSRSDPGEREAPEGVRRLSDPELRTTFAAALLAAGFKVSVNPFAWKDLSEACQTYWPDASPAERHEKLRASVADWVRASDATKSRGWDHREWIRWANQGNAAQATTDDERSKRVAAQLRKRQEHAAFLARETEGQVNHG